MSKTVLITGGSRGIGRGIADYLYDNGYSIAITSRHEADEEAKNKYLCIVADNSNANDRHKAVDEALSKFGHIDLLVNNAGIAPRIRADLLTMGEDSMRELLDVNLIATSLSQSEGSCWITQSEGSCWIS